MDEEVQRILNTPIEDRTVEFKSSASWNELKHKVALAALGMANLPLDGYIIIGVRDESNHGFTLEGVADQHNSDYDNDRVQDFICSFMSHPVELKAQFVDFRDKRFYAVRVGYYGRSLVAAKKGTPDDCCSCRIEKGQVYCRPKGVKPQTRKVEPTDLDDLAHELALIRYSAFLEDLAQAFKLSPVEKQDLNVTYYERERASF